MKGRVRSVQEQNARRVAQLSFGLAALAAIGLLLYLSRRPPPAPPVQPRAELPPIVTPSSFENFIGPTRMIRSNGLTVELTVNRPGGTSERRLYQITVDRATELSVYNDKPTGPEITPITLTDLRIGDMVGVFANRDVSQLKAFTAVKVYKIISS